MRELLKAAAVLGKTNSDLIKSGMPSSSFYKHKKDAPDDVLPESWRDKAQAIIVEAQNRSASKKGNGNGHAHHDLDIEDYAPGDDLELTLDPDDSADEGKEPEQLEASDDAEDCSSDTIDDELDDDAAPPIISTQGIPARADAETMVGLIAQASASRSLDDASNVLHDAANAFASMTQGAALINAIMAALPPRTVTRQILTADFRAMRTQALAIARATACPETETGGVNLTDYLLDLTEEHQFKVWRDSRTSAPILTIAPAHHVRADSRAANHALIRLYDAHPSTGRRVIPPDNAKAVQSLLGARVSDDAPTNTTALRYAAVRNNRGHLTGVVIDNGDQNRGGIYVTSDGWRPIDAASIDDLGVAILRPNDALPLCAPAAHTATIDDALEAIMDLIALPSTEDAKVYLGTLVASMLPSPDVTLPIISFSGPPGAGKTTAARMTKMLLDPSSDAAGGKAKSEDDLYVVASTARATVFDNLTSISVDISDALCRIASGGAVPKRALYTDGEKTALHVHATSIITTIELRLLTRPDIVDRLVAFLLVVKPERSSDTRVVEMMAEKMPVVRRVMLDCLSSVIKHINHDDDVKGERLTTMALVMSALDEAYPDVSFSEAFKNRRIIAAKSVALTDPLIAALLRIVFDNPPRTSGGYLWKGATSGLFNKLPEQRPAPLGWPQSAVALGIKLKGLTPTLKLIGVDIGSVHSRSGSLIQIAIAKEHVNGIQAAAVAAGCPFEAVTTDDVDFTGTNDRNRFVGRITAATMSGTTDLHKRAQQLVMNWCGDNGVSNVHSAATDDATIESLKQLLEAVQNTLKGGA